MRTLLLFLFVVGLVHAEGGPKVTGTLGGKGIAFPAKSLEAGIPAAIGLLESCSDESGFDAKELMAAEQSDHIRMTFPTGQLVNVGGKKYAITELVFRRPFNTGVFWIKAGDEWHRFAKYDFKKEAPFAKWLDMATAVR